MTRLTLPDRNVASGICHNCQHHTGCHWTNPTRPIQHCSEHAVVPGVVGRVAGIQITVPEPLATRAASPTRGLCINCDHVAICALPRPATGVWHCDEYA